LLQSLLLPFLVPDVVLYHLFVLPYVDSKIPARPEALPDEIPSAFSLSTRLGDGAVSLDKAVHLPDGDFGAIAWNSICVCFGGSRPGVSSMDRPGLPPERPGVSSMDRPGLPPEMSNFHCLPGRAGGSPIVLARAALSPGIKRKSLWDQIIPLEA